MELNGIKPADGAKHAKHQHALLQFKRNGKKAEQHQPDKHIVDRQRLLDQVAGQELQRARVGDLRRAGAVPHRPPEQAVEQEAHRDPDQRPVQRLAGTNLMGALLAQHDEVDEQRDQHGRDEKGPQPGRRDGVHGHSRREGVETRAERSCGGRSPAGPGRPRAGQPY